MGSLTPTVASVPPRPTPACAVGLTSRTAKTTILSGGIRLERRRGSADLSIAPRTPRKTIASAQSKSDVAKKIKCPIILRRTNGILFHLCEYVYRYDFFFRTPETSLIHILV